MEKQTRNCHIEDTVANAMPEDPSKCSIRNATMDVLYKQINVWHDAFAFDRDWQCLCILERVRDIAIMVRPNDAVMGNGWSCLTYCSTTSSLAIGKLRTFEFHS